MNEYYMNIIREFELPECCKEHQRENQTIVQLLFWQTILWLMIAINSHSNE